MPFRRVLSVIAVLAVAACAQPPIPTDTFYRLDVADPAPAGGAPVFDGIIEVQAFAADGLASERALIYSEPGTPTLRQYSYHFWVEAPTEAVQRELTDHLRASGLFGKVVTPRFRVRPDLEIQGRIARLEQYLEGNGTARVVAEVELGAQRTGRGLGLVMLETYRIERPAANASPTAAAEALRDAMGEIFARFTTDLAAKLTAGS
ncbi:MAG: ABC-type transport auxiliary lipoprotein family protein [Rhodospirillaceae bacterium]